MNSHLFTALALLIVMWFTSCTSTATNPPINTEDSLVTVQDYELFYNHMLLKGMYLYAKDELGEFSEYRGMGTPGHSYSDVYYMYSQMLDPYTRYFDPIIAAQAFEYYMSSDQEAIIGIYRDLESDTISVVRVVPNSPAEQAGIQVGDQILTVNGSDVTGSSRSLYDTLSAGGAGTVLTLQLLRQDSLFEVTVTKALLDIPTVWLDFVDSIPVIQIEWFAENSVGDSGTAKEFRLALEAAGSFQTAVIDLRDNPGGSVDQCMAMTDLLIRQGILIHAISHEVNEDNEFYVDTIIYDAQTLSSAFDQKNYVFLANEGSASCSELMLAGVRSHTNWPLIGDTTFGKGIAQSLMPTFAEGLAVVTSTEYRDATWNNYHHQGFAPDYRVLDADSGLALAIQLAKGSTSLLRPNKSLTISSDVKRHKMAKRITNRPPEAYIKR